MLTNAVSFSQVAAEDIVVTADVDAFIMTPAMAAPLRRLQDKKIWIYRYELSKNTGYTFMMPFIGARAGTWREILRYPGSLPQMVAEYGKSLNFNEGYTWDIDQHIVSRAILKSGYCTIPANNTLWKEVNLEPT